MYIDVQWIGYFAGFCTAVAQFPQALKVIRSKNTESISLGTYGVMTLGVLCWFIYGFLLCNLPMIVANGICLIPSLIVLVITMMNSGKSTKKSI